ncbi:MAG: hypothetical protein ACR2H2_02820 [Solirubrobacteraceae bacterium]
MSKQRNTTPRRQQRPNRRYRRLLPTAVAAAALAAGGAGVASPADAHPKSHGTPQLSGHAGKAGAPAARPPVKAR